MSTNHLTVLTNEQSKIPKSNQPTNQPSNHPTKVEVVVECGALPVRYEWNRVEVSSIHLANGLMIAGLCLCLMFGVFNIVNRKKSVIRFTSPKLNLILIMGCALVYVSLSFFGTAGSELDSCSSMLPVGLSTMDAQLDLTCAETDNACCADGATAGCIPRNWVFAVGLTLVFCTLFSKTSRIVKIFTSNIPKQQIIFR